MLPRIKNILEYILLNENLFCLLSVCVQGAETKYGIIFKMCVGFFFFFFFFFFLV